MRKLLMSVAGALFLSAGAAAADGGPGPGVAWGWTGVAHGNLRYVTIPTGSWTTVQAIERHGGRVVTWLPVKGTWGVPLVASDGTTGGLLRDGRTLLLTTAQPGPALRKRSAFMLIDVKRMSRLRTIRLKGDFAFDALSPDARYLYLIEHVNALQLLDYRVRAYDFRTGRLLKKIVADRRSWETSMQGMPVSRLSTDGWAYTLYANTGRAPFIHALDTRHVSAVCIDLPWRSDPANIWSFRVRKDAEGDLVVRGPHGRTLAAIDRHTFRVLSSVRNP